ncbi:hypothetical protein HF888_11305 [Bermanella marisrubri]|uniref:PilZ domain-containing protein n=1 Tax=Bermanella marisrubri TaxID=207949 RepID=Q1N186_9GAMM|nr:hypothetical protein [Bermanella marisrubri]EAT11965.1 hypothetical protein RED65_11510 [Oceanobacter sp. RED65] [Bermanella marisrubri]QIZ84769.1 hypothetical protein HF888_11305 [Bermanella marisrubri]
MELSIHTISWLGRPKKPVSAKAIKFNRYSLIFQSRVRLKPGQLVFINLSAGTHSLREVNARVENCEKAGPHFQTQVKFVLERPDKQPYREAISVLKAIENAVPPSIRAPLHMQELSHA